MAYITAENHGKTFAQRNAVYCNHFKYEVEATVAAGLILDATKDKIKELAVRIADITQAKKTKSQPKTTPSTIFCH